MSGLDIFLLCLVVAAASSAITANYKEYREIEKNREKTERDRIYKERARIGQLEKNVISALDEIDKIKQQSIVSIKTGENFNDVLRSFDERLVKQREELQTMKAKQIELLTKSGLNTSCSS